MSGTDDTVLDTFCFEKNEIYLKIYHIQRSFEALVLLNTKITRSEISDIYNEIERTFSPEASEENVFRLLLKFTDKLESQIEILQKSSFPSRPTVQVLTSIRTPAGLGKQNYKWQQRDFWEKAMQSRTAGADDLIFLNTQNEVTESSRCNLFFYDSKADFVYTPPLDSGCINGVYRRYVIDHKKIQLPDHQESKKVIERKILFDEINEFQIYLANSVRRVLKAKLNC